jgi:uncharacterized membrane protein YbhN (UPF0104 family)
MVDAACAESREDSRERHALRIAMTGSTPPAAALAGTRVPVRTAILRAATSLGLLALILWWLPWQSLTAAIGRIPAGVWLGVTAGFVAGHAVSAFKWRLLLGAAGVPIPAALALRAHALGLFANLCLPSLVGGDVVRAGLVVRDHGQAAAVAVGSVGDRVNDTLALVLLAALGALLTQGAGDPSALRLLLGIALLLPAGLGGAVLLVRVLPLDRLPGPLARAAGRLREAQASLLARPGAALQALALSLAIQGAFVALNVRIAWSMGIDQPAAVWLLVWPLAKLVALVPVSLGGIGVREVALAGLLAPFGVEATAAVAQSLSWEVVLVGSGLAAGAAALALGRSTAAARGREEAG